MIPTYGQSDVLPRAIDSAISQDYDDLEILVLDDASMDSTENVVRSYSDKRLRYVKNASNLGRVGNYRQGLSLASGDFVLNLDGDDWLCDDQYISDAMDLVRRFPCLAMVFGRVATYDQLRDQLLEPSTHWNLPRVSSGTDIFLRYAEGTVVIPHTSALYHRDTAISLGFYEHNVLGADAVSLLKLLPGNSIGFIDRTVAVWRLHDKNSSRSATLQELIANFAVADVPSEYVVLNGLLPDELAFRWRRRLSMREAHKRLAGLLVSHDWRTAGQFFLNISVHRPTIAVLVLATLGRSSLRKIFGNQ